MSVLVIGGALAANRWIAPPPPRTDSLVASAAAGLPAASTWTSSDDDDDLLVEARGDIEEGRDAALEALRQVRITSRALSHIRRRYVEPRRIDPPRMLAAALQALAHRVPEMLVRGDGTAATPLEVRIADARLVLDTAGVTDLFRLNWRLLEAMRFVADQLPPDVNASSVEYVAVNGLLRTLDPYSYMLDPDQYRDMRTHTGGRFGGLGIRILTLEGVLTIVGVIEGSPAERAGLLENDQIVQIDGEDTLNMSIDDAVDRLRGKVGAPARLMIRRKGEPDREIVVVRAIIHLKSVQSRVLDTGVGYARIKGFQRGTAKELARTLAKLHRSGGRRGLILDLRNNPGGLLDEAVKVCDLLLDGGTIVVTVEGASQRRDVREANTDNAPRQLPVAVLINDRSASASEIVAGALRNSNRAIVIGERSFGKGTVQVPFEIGKGALKLTVAKYLVPGDMSIQDVGVTPDVALHFLSAGSRIRLFDDRHRRKRKKWLHLDAPPPKPSHRLRIVLPGPRSARKGKSKAATRNESVAQFREREPIRRAARLLRYAGKSRADETLTDAIPHIAEMQQADDRALTAQLLRAGVDWRPGPRTETPKLKLTVTAPDGGFRVEAGRTIRFPVTVQNLGRKPLYRVHIVSRSADYGLDGREAVVGKLAPGELRTVKVAARPSRRHVGAPLTMRLVAAQDGAIRRAEEQVTVTVLARKKPDLRVRYWLDDEPLAAAEASTEVTAAMARAAKLPPGDGYLQPKEIGRLRIVIDNVGTGVAGGLVATLRSLSGQRLHLEEGRVQLGPLHPGKSVEAVFVVHGERGAPRNGRARVAAGLLEARLKLRDERYGYRRTIRLRLPWSRTRAMLRSAKIKATRDRIDRLADRNRNRFSHAPVILVGDEQSHPEPDGALFGPLRVDPAAGTCTLTLRGQARFESDDLARRFVTVSVSGTKQSYTAGHRREAVQFAAALRLDTGLNTVTIRARAGPDSIADRKVLIECLQQPVPAEAPSDGPRPRLERP